MTESTTHNGLRAGWTWARLGDVLTDTRNGIYKPDTYYGRGVPILKMFNIGRLNGRWNLASVDMLEVTPSELGFYGLEVGDILLNRVNSRELVGKCAVVNGETRGAVYESKNMRLRVNRAVIDPDWLAAWLNSEGGRQQIDNKLRQIVGQATVNRTDVVGLNVPLPPVPEQQRIMARLREQLAEVEQARAAVVVQLKAAEALPAAFLRAVFSSPTAQQWPRHNFGEICEIIAKQVDPRSPDYRDLPHVSGENIVSGICKLENVRTAAEDGMTSGKYLFEPGDVLYSKLRPYLRKAALPSFRGLCSADMYPIRVNPEVLDASFATWMLVSEPFTNYAIGESERSRMPKLNREQLFGWEAPLPQLAEQQTIAARVTAEFDQTQWLREQVTQKLAAVEKLPATLLREAFSGRI